MENSSRTSYYIFLAALSVNLIAFSAGSAYSWTSPVLPKLKNQTQSPLPSPLTTTQESWIASLTSLGAVFGPIFSGIMAEKIGRKKTLLIFSVPSLVSHLIVAYATRIEMLFVARFLVGIGCGCVYSVMPNFVGDISEDSNRGLLGCFMTLMITCGLLFNYLIGPFVSIKILSFGNIIPIILFMVLFSLLVPESPYYFLSLGDKQGAEASLMKLRGKSTKGVEKELLKLVTNLEIEKENKASIKDLFKSRACLRALIIVNGLMIIQQFSGINAVLGFMETIFSATGSSIPPEYSTIFVGIVQMLTVVVSSQLIDRLGRKILLLISTIGSFLSLVSMGLYFYLKNNNYRVDSIFWLPLMSLVVYIVVFNLGLSCVPWAMMGELFPSNLKSAASTISTTFCLALAFIITMFFPQVSLTLGMAGSFWGFGLFCLAGAGFVYILVPETKGKSFQEIQEMLGEKK
ncbi:facilitated trehalose transporter Tret1-like [Aethina tumida]|uniref:facilitated trehalose transporter Tret1-like n=1 Tax=Aethina tumida TaxID=116153 RepID=UPI00096B3A84|nr:facilitated trehalose transporter Tret1-like [Aethina tumida]